MNLRAELLGGVSCMDLKKLFTEKNVGGIDRIARILIGVVLALIALFGPYDFTLRVIFGLLALIVGVYTGIFSHCTLYSLMGWNTRR
jgi:hypothetical protein